MDFTWVFHHDDGRAGEDGGPTWPDPQLGRGGGRGGGGGGGGVTGDKEEGPAETGEIVVD